MFINFLLPEEAQVQDVRINDKPAAYLLDREASAPVAWDLLELKSGERGTARVVYLLRGAADPSDERGMTLTLFPQALVRPDEFQFRLAPPPGYEASFSGGVEDELPGVGISTSGQLDETLTLETDLKKF
jgi:hypothetical protein